MVEDEGHSEYCGIVGISTRPRTDFAKKVWALTGLSVPDAGYRALVRLKHRGQASNGSSFYDGEKLVSVKYSGPIDERLEEDSAMARNVRAMIGQVRYGTAGKKGVGDIEEAQPFEGRGFHFAFNGNIPNADALRTALIEEDPSWKPKTTVDTEIITEMISRAREASIVSIAEELQKVDRLFSHGSRREAELLLRKVRGRDAFREAIESTMRKLHGSFSATVLTDRGALYAFRDFLGTRPLVLGKIANRFIVASETVSIERPEEKGSKTLTGKLFGKYIKRILREIRPGEIFRVDSLGRPNSYQVARPPEYECGCAHCIFEHIYFSHMLSKVRVNGRWKTMAEIREHLGVLAAPGVSDKVRGVITRLKAEGHDVSEKNILVVGIPHSGLMFAKGIAKKTGWTLSAPKWEDRLELTPNQSVREWLFGPIYSLHSAIYRRSLGGGSRTFIRDTQEDRRKKTREKYGLSADEIKGKVIVLPDDSIVRGTTLMELVAMFKEAGALAVIPASSAPPIIKGCYRGIDTKDEELIVPKVLTAEVGVEEALSRELGADAVYYGKLGHLLKATGFTPKKGFIRACTECLTRRAPEEELRKANAKKRERTPRVLFGRRK